MNFSKLTTTEKSTIDITDLIQSKLDDYYLKTLLGFAQKTKEYEVYVTDCSNNNYLVIKPFIYPLGLIQIDEVKEILNHLQGHYLILPTIYNIDSLSDIVGVNIQKRVHFLQHNLDKNALASFINFPIKRYKVLTPTETHFNFIKESKIFINHFRNFANYSELMKYGTAAIALDTKNQKIISIASSFCYFNNMIEIQVDTLSEYRRHGLAQATSALLISNCYTQGLIPRWDAATEASARLGRNLGFGNEKNYFMLYL